MSKSFTSVDFYKEHLEIQKRTFERLAKFKDEVVPLIDEFLKGITRPKQITIRATRYPKVLINYTHQKHVVVLFSQVKGVNKMTASVYSISGRPYGWEKKAVVTSGNIKEFIEKYNTLDLT